MWRRVSSGQRPSLLVAIGLVAVAATVGCVAAAAGSSPPSAAVQQYVESLPTAGGGRRPAANSKPSRAAVPAVAAAAVQQYVESLPTAGGGAAGPPASTQGGRSGSLLDRIRTSPDLGAPQTRLTGGSRPRGANDSALGAAVNAIASGDNSHLLGLVLALVLASVGLVAVRIVSHTRTHVRRSD